MTKEEVKDKLGEDTYFKCWYMDKPERVVSVEWGKDVRPDYNVKTDGLHPTRDRPCINGLFVNYEDIQFIEKMPLVYQSMAMGGIEFEKELKKKYNKYYKNEEV